MNQLRDEKQIDEFHRGFFRIPKRPVPDYS